MTLVAIGMARYLSERAFIIRLQNCYHDMYGQSTATKTTSILDYLAIQPIASDETLLGSLVPLLSPMEGTSTLVDWWPHDTPLKLQFWYCNLYAEHRSHSITAPHFSPPQIAR
jgi:hypothetical protein